MTPNKIYINVHPLGVDYSIVPIPDFGGVEYIRKDALLEWLKKKTENAEIIVANSVERWVTRKVYKQVMDKLEAM